MTEIRETYLTSRPLLLFRLAPMADGMGAVLVRGINGTTPGGERLPLVATAVAVRKPPPRPVASRAAGHAAMVAVTLLFSVWNVLGERLTRVCDDDDNDGGAGCDDGDDAAALTCPLVLACYRELAAAPLMLACAAARVGLCGATAPRAAATANDRAAASHPSAGEHGGPAKRCVAWLAVGSSLWGTQLLFLVGLAMTSANVAALYQVRKCVSCKLRPLSVPARSSSPFTRHVHVSESLY